MIIYDNMWKYVIIYDTVINDNTLKYMILLIILIIFDNIWWYIVACESCSLLFPDTPKSLIEMDWNEFLGFPF